MSEVLPTSPPPVKKGGLPLPLQILLAVGIFSALGVVLYLTRHEWHDYLFPEYVKRESLDHPENRERPRPQNGPGGAFVDPLSAFDRSKSNLSEEARHQLRGGGPPVDAIRAISKPKFLSIKEALRVFKKGERVVGVVIDGAPRAYMVKMLNRHEVVNDENKGTAYAVTYCPLCDSFGVYNRALGGKTVELGVSGMLYNSNVIFFDRSLMPKKLMESPLWSQMALSNSSGQQQDNALDTVPFEVTTLGAWMERYPETEVMSTDTGMSGYNYNQDPYEGYDESEDLVFPVQPIENKYPLKARVIALWTSDSHVCVFLKDLAEHKENVKWTVPIGAKQAELEYDPEAKSIRVVKADGGVKWIYSYWFAWYAFNPETKVAQPPKSK